MKMKAAITGASGLVGSALRASLEQDGWEVVPMVRTRKASGVYWNPGSGEIDSGGLEGLDAVIHLAGDSIGEGRWSEAKKKQVFDSRIEGTKLLCGALCGLKEPPKVWVSASAIGFYGDRGDERLTEESGPGTGFLAELCQAWEAATKPARERGIRVVNLRIGVVMSGAGGALRKMLTPFRMGAGGVLGAGTQHMAWVAIDDVVGAIRFVIGDASLAGPVNAVSPNPLTNREFTKTLGRVLKRPTILPMPSPIAKLAFGAEKANQLLLTSNRIYPGVLEKAGYRFAHPELESCLRAALGK